MPDKYKHWGAPPSHKSTEGHDPPTHRQMAPTPLPPPKNIGFTILRWGALAFGLLLWSSGVAAMYGDDYKLAVVLYFFGIALVLTDFFGLEDIRSLHGKKRAFLIFCSSLVATAWFALSVVWIQVRISHVTHNPSAEKRQGELAAFINEGIQLRENCRSTNFGDADTSANE